MGRPEDLPLRDDLRGIAPYGAPQIDVPVRLNTNENPYPPSDALVADIAVAVAAVAASLNRYPDRDAVDLRKDLAAYLTGQTGVSLTADGLWAACGSNEVMQQILQAFGGPGRRAMSFEPTYAMYPAYARSTATAWSAAPRGDDFTIDPERAVAAITTQRPDVVFLSSPNNPTGTAVPLPVIEAIAEATEGIVVVDEAYAEFARPGTASAATLLARHPRLVVTRTMSKAFAMAGTRLGYLAADPAVVEALQIVRLPYHLSTVTQAVARVGLAHAEELLGTVAALREERDLTVAWLHRAGFEVVDSDANFALFGRFGDRRAVWQALLDRGVLVREMGPPAWLRVSIGLPEEMAAFKQALQELSGKARP